MNLKHLSLALVRILIILFCLFDQINAQELRSTLFLQADEALRAANAVRASILAPESYEKASHFYMTAEKKLERKKSIESITEDLNKAIKYFQAATDASRLSRVTLETALRARDDAKAAEAEKHAANEWGQAEKLLSQAARRLEHGNVKKSQSKAKAANERFRAAELSAIKNNYLLETRRLIEQAKHQRAHKFAPKTLSRAKTLLAQAEKELNENRYDTDQARSLARTAKSEVNHALYLKESLSKVRHGDESLENFALKSEQPLLAIAGALDMVVEFDNGTEKPTEEIIFVIDQLRKDSMALSDSRGEILMLEEKVRTLEKRLGVQSSSIKHQEEIKRKFSKVETMFTSQQAQVYRQSGNILIRMVGLNFNTGKSVIESEYFSLLRKVIEAIQYFPKAILVVEGHTDSFGSDIENQTLSKARADAVVEYLRANMPAGGASVISAVGYGESNPVANNETVDGRRKNRRIDLLIKQKL